MSKHKNPAAVALGRLARGVPKTLTEEQRQAKRELIARNRRLHNPNNRREAMAQALKDRLAQEGVSREWMDEHLEVVH